MNKATRIAAIVIIIAAMAVLALTQWLPALLFLPVGTAMLMWDGSKFSTSLRNDRPDGWQNE